MPRTLADVKADLIAECARGSRGVDERVLNTRVAMAIRFFERNYTLPYMRRLVSFTVVANSKDPGPYVLPALYKSFKFVRFPMPTGEFQIARHVEPEDIKSIEVGVPKRYWIDADKWIWFDAVPGEDITCYILGRVYSGALDDGDIHWLFENAYDVVLGKTMEYLCDFLRLSELKSNYVDMYTDAVRTLVLAVEEGKNSDSEVWLGMEGDPADG